MVKTITIIFLSVALVIEVYLFLQRRRISKAKNKIHELLLRAERNKQVYAFRMRIIHEYPIHVAEKMPSYEAMMFSDKPLTVKEWIDVDEFVNLN